MIFKWEVDVRMLMIVLEFIVIGIDVLKVEVILRL